MATSGKTTSVYEETSFGLNIKLATLGEIDVISFLDKVEKALRRLGKPFEEVESHLQKVAEDLKRKSPTDVGLIGVINSFMDRLKLKELESKAAEAKNEWTKIAQNIKHPFGLLGKTVALGTEAFGSFYAAMKPGQKFVRFAEGIAKVNMQLRSLANNSTLAVRELVGAGNALSVFGGSANDTAGMNKKYETTISNMFRGGGLGFLQESAWKYGFGFDITESSENRFERAIQHYQKLSKRDRIAFAQSEGWSRAQIDAANMGVDWYRNQKERRAHYGAYSEEAGMASTRMRESMTELSASFQMIKDKLFIAIEPVITTVAGWLTSFSAAIGRCPKLLIGFGAAVSGVVALMTGAYLIGGIMSLAAWARLAANALRQVAVQGEISTLTTGKPGGFKGALNAAKNLGRGALNVGKGALHLGGSALAWLGGLAGGGAAAGASIVAVGAIGAAVGYYASKAIVENMGPGASEQIRQSRKDVEDAKKWLDKVRADTEARVKKNGFSTRTLRSLEAHQRHLQALQKKSRLADTVQNLHGNADALSDYESFRAGGGKTTNDSHNVMTQTINNYGPVTDTEIKKQQDATKEAVGALGMTGRSGAGR